MTFEEKLVNQEYDRIWQEYCGFLDLDMDSYMKIQKRLLAEQMRLWCSSPIGKKILRGRNPGTVPWCPLPPMMTMRTCFS